MITMLITVLFFVSIIALIYALFRMKHLVNQIRILKKEKDILDVAKQKLHSQMDEARLECDRITAEIDQYKTKLETLSNDKKILEEVQHSLNIQLNEASQEKNACLEEIKKLKALIAEKDEEIKGKDLEINKLIDDKKCLEERFEDSNKEGNFDGDALDALVEELNKGSKEKQEEYEAWYSRLLTIDDDEFKEEFNKWYLHNFTIQDDYHLQRRHAVWEIRNKRIDAAIEKEEQERKIQREKELERQAQIVREREEKERIRAEEERRKIEKKNEENRRLMKEIEDSKKKRNEEFWKSLLESTYKLIYKIELVDRNSCCIKVNEKGDIKKAISCLRDMQVHSESVSKCILYIVDNSDNKLVKVKYSTELKKENKSNTNRKRSRFSLYDDIIKDSMSECIYTYEVSYAKDNNTSYMMLDLDVDLLKDMDLLKDVKTYSEKDYNEVTTLVTSSLKCYLMNRQLRAEQDEWNNIISNGISRIAKLKSSKKKIDEFALNILMNSDYLDIFQKKISCIYDNEMLLIEYELPQREKFYSIKEYHQTTTSNNVISKPYPETYLKNAYEQALYGICLRSIYEVFTKDKDSRILAITFNGYVTETSSSTGLLDRKCIMSLQVDREKFMNVHLAKVNPKDCFKAFKGVSGAKLVDLSPITPILTFNKEDRRFIEGRSVSIDKGTNLAAMHWEDFEQLVRELFELEFAKNGGEVRVTQASRDGGVDAVVFDPDPLRGGKIVIQAKRYTNTVGVSAVRDLYGTVINEGANSGILITTSDYGHDSYEFAKDKPLKLLNGGHLLAMIRKHGHKAYINIQEAKESIAGK